MGRKMKLLDEMSSHLTNEEKAKKKDIQEALFNYSELQDEAPRWLKGRALTEWKRIVPLLKKDTPISALDVGLLAGYCRAYGIVQTANDGIKKSGLVVTNPETGTKKKNPYFEIQSQAFKDMKMFASELGLSLNSRQKLETSKANKKDESDPFARMLK